VKDLEDLFREMLTSHQHWQSALKECWEWNERLKDDTGGYRGTGDIEAREWESQCREELRVAFDTYIAARFGLPLGEATKFTPAAVEKGTP
jgi:hypothetical protein